MAEEPGVRSLGRAKMGDLLAEVATRIEATQNSTKERDLARLCREAIENLRHGVLRYPPAEPDAVTDATLVVELARLLSEVETILANAFGHAEAQYEPPALEALALVREALSWVDDARAAAR